MAGAYCRYCDQRCFVDRRLPADAKKWAGQDLHMATCDKGAEHDREATGYDFTTAINPYAQATSPATQRYDWHGWENEPDMTGDGEGDPDKWFLTITQDGEEYALIVHRTCAGKYPLDGLVAQEKLDRAARIVAALNDYTGP